MKFGNIAVYALCACLLLTGCGAAEKDSSASGLVFPANGTRIVISAPAQPVLDALGGPIQYSEATSCAFDGVEKTYYYGSFYLTTYPAEDGEYVGSVWFADDTVSTEEGIRIGSTRQEVEAAYGDTAFENPGSCIITAENGTLTIVLTGDTVTSVLYETPTR